jgi:serine/threonine protein kinase/tetratricopeptide (TPR) repeat protein
VIGKTISHYRILEKLGEGGMGVVYKGDDTKLKRTVALKFLPPELTKDPQAKARFIQEAQAAAALDHPNICAVFEISEAEGTTYIVMPYIGGQSLKEKITAGPLSVEEALDIASQVAEGLKEAHERGIIHRDIKPANIMLTEKGQAKIMDFGLAKLTSVADVTKTLTVMGTLAYMSPEQARGEAVDQRTDIWSFGATLYEMLTGQMPFGRKHDQAIIYSILNDTPEPASQLRSEIPKRVERVVQKAMEKDKLRRYQNMAELLKDLTAARVSGFGVPKTDKSIIVLPFENISPDPEQEYFCDGMTEEIITDLSHVHDLLVISRSSAMTFKDTKKTIPEIARAVNVRYVLEGSVRKAGNNLRIAAQLIDAETDVHLWADKYSGTLEDVFDIQDKVSHAIVAGLKMRLAPDEEQKIVEHPLANAPAYECYLRAKHEIARWTEPALDRALHYLETALEMVGDNAVLFAGLALVHLAYSLGTFRTDEETLQKAEQYAKKALQMDAELAPGHYVLGMIAHMRGDMRQSFIHTKRAAWISPNDPDAVLWFACAAGHVGKPSASKPFVEGLLRADPLSCLTHIASVYQLFYDGRFEEALESGRVAFRLDPEGVISRCWYVMPLMWNRRFEEAWDVIDGWRRDMPEHAWLQGLISLFYALQGKKAESLALLSEQIFSLMRKDAGGVLLAENIYALNGETEEALKWIEYGLDIGCINYPFLSQHDPYLANIRGEPRFKKLMERVKYEWEHFEV